MACKALDAAAVDPLCADAEAAARPNSNVQQAAMTARGDIIMVLLL
jgi:hypothetical protein